MPISLSVLYPEPTSFDIDYYLTTHIPLAHRLWDKHGLQSLDVITYKAAPDGSKPFSHAAHMKWETLAGMQKALDTNGEDGKAVMGDIPNFYKGQPVVVSGDVVAS